MKTGLFQPTTSMKDSEALHQAAQYGRDCSGHPDYKHGAIIRIKNEYYYGANRLKTNSKSPKPFKGVCAEFDAVLKVCNRLLPYSHKPFKKATLYVARYNKSGNLANSKPCKWCQEMIDKLGIKRVVYSTNEI